MARTRTPLSVRFYFFQDRWWGRMMRALQGTHTGLWLGVLTHERLQTLDEAHFQVAPSYLDEGHNTRGLFDWEREAVGAAFGGCRRVAVIAAGAGREVLALSQMGFDAVGYECNPALVDFAADLLPRHGCDGVVRPIARDAAPVADGPFDGVIMGWGAYMLIVGRHRRIAFLREVRASLAPGGPVLVSFFNRPEKSPRMHLAWRVACVVRRLLGHEPAEMGDDLSPLYMHRFLEAELRGELVEAGFTVTHYVPEGRGQHAAGWAVGVSPHPSPATA